MASIRDVAKRANVAACTVSRVLNGTSYVAPETRQKIEQAMEELNYVPNELARSMFRNRAGIIAMTVPNIRHPFFSSLAGYIEKELYKQGYKLMLCSTDDDLEKEREYIQTLKSNIVDGIILGVNHLDKKEYESIKKPMISLDHEISQNIPLIVSDHHQGGGLAAQYFIESGCRYVIHIGDEALKTVESYKGHVALEESLKAEGIRSEFVGIKWNDFDFNGYLELAKKVLRENPQIDGIMAADMPAAAFLKAAAQMGRKVPEDFCVVAYDGTYVTHMNIIDLTTVVQPIKEIGKKAVEIITGMVDGKTPTKSKFLMELHTKRGDTTR